MHENGPEQVRVTLEGVPDGAEIRLPSGVSAAPWWISAVAAGRSPRTAASSTRWSSVTNDANGAMAIKVTAQSLDNGALGPEVNGTIHLDVSPVSDAPSTCCLMIPRWHRRTSRSSSRVCRLLGRGCGQRHHGSAPLGGARHPDPAGRERRDPDRATVPAMVLTGTLADLNALLRAASPIRATPDFQWQ